MILASRLKSRDASVRRLSATILDAMISNVDYAGIATLLECCAKVHGHVWNTCSAMSALVLL